MSDWSSYEDRLAIDSSMLRANTVRRAKQRFAIRAKSTPSFKTVLINGEQRAVTILNTQYHNIKNIFSMPNETLEAGNYVDWVDNRWLIISVDADEELYSRAQMKQCNHLLKWVNREGAIVEKWCIVEDGTKYLIGEKTKELLTIGDARIAITIPKDSDTVDLNRGKRFIVDDVDSTEPIAYEITKPNRLFSIFENEGVYRFILKEVNTTANDNLELRIADYYSRITPTEPAPEPNTGGEVWL